MHSYDEDEMVEDPKLAEHLAHFGINIASMTKVRSDRRKEEERKERGRREGAPGCLHIHPYTLTPPHPHTLTLD